MALSGRMLREFFFSVSSVSKCAFNLPVLLHTMLKWSEPLKDAVSTILVYPDPPLRCWKYSSFILQQLLAQLSLSRGRNEPTNKWEPFLDISKCLWRQIVTSANSENTEGIQNGLPKYQSPDFLASTSQLFSWGTVNLWGAEETGVYLLFETKWSFPKPN